MNTPLSPREELATLTAALRAQLEWLGESGAAGVPRADPGTKAARGHVERENPPREGQPSAVTPSARAVDAPPSPPAEPVPAWPGAAPSRPGSAPERLVVLQSEVASCTRCALHAERTQTVFARGTGSAGICFVGEGPGADEDAQGVPFVGKAGQLLDRMITAMGFSRDEVYVCNIVKCRPPKNRKPEADEMAACRPYLAEQIELLEPKVIVALGATAVEGLLGIAGGITRLRGSFRLYKGRIPVMPTFHPAFLLRQPQAKRDVWNDLQEVLRHLGRPLPTR